MTHLLNSDSKTSIIFGNGSLRSTVSNDENTYLGMGPKRLLEQNHRQLSCDEGALIINLLIQKLGYKTRLVDLFTKNDNKSQHTTLQVFRDERWMTYDFTTKKTYIDPIKTVRYKRNDLYLKYRYYPSNIFQHLLLRNKYLREMRSSKLVRNNKFIRDFSIKIRRSGYQNLAI